MSIYLNSTIKKKKNRLIYPLDDSNFTSQRGHNENDDHDANFNRSTNPRKTDTDIVQRRLAGNLNDKQCIARGLADILKCQ